MKRKRLDETLITTLAVGDTHLYRAGDDVVFEDYPARKKRHARVVHVESRTTLTIRWRTRWYHRVADFFSARSARFIRAWRAIWD